ncbi:signal peptidase complex subunit 1 [Vairimorpha necatrix]|uniref:Signal peptidase complex subunit 1 n=1 Tax=Vairimorpha necatrix TaxID=6039 RepID=A0AAX4JG39_9MICR
MNILNKLDQPIDYHGQELSRKLFYVIIYIGYTFSLLTGILYNDLKYTLFLGLITVACVFLTCVPSWKIYRKNPLKFTRKSNK